jgi:hypothetical protein
VKYQVPVARFFQHEDARGRGPDTTNETIMTGDETAPQPTPDGPRRGHPDRRSCRGAWRRIDRRSVSSGAVAGMILSLVPGAGRANVEATALTVPSGGPRAGEYWADYAVELVRRAGPT